jgi:23S rRNA-/tRNA-specific pseudouridylate synthase
MKEKLSFRVQQKIRLDQYLRTVLPEEKSLAGQELSNSKIRRLIVAGAVSVNGHTVTRPAFELRGKSQVCVEFDTEKFFFEKQPDDIQFEVTDSSVLYEDENLIFINKPAFFSCGADYYRQPRQPPRCSCGLPVEAQPRTTKSSLCRHYAPSGPYHKRRYPFYQKPRCK